MGRRIVFVIVLILVSTALIGEPATTYEPPFTTQSAEVMAQGGSFNANGHGFYSLFSNPASFAGEESSLTILSVMPWIYAFPDSALLTSLSGIVKDPGSAISGLNDLFTGPGFGAGASAGVGFVGNGLGLGLIYVADVFARGPNTLGINVDSHVTVGFVGGFALPIHAGPVTVRVGGAFRPMYRIRVPKLGIAAFAGLLSEASGGLEINAPVYHGVGLAIDAGTIASLGPFSVGVALRDLFGTSFQYVKSTVSELVDALKAGGLPEGGNLVTGENGFVIPMTLHLGAAFRPDFGPISNIIDPGLHFNWEYSSVPDGENSFWTAVHVGSEVTLFNRISLRAGLNQGYITAGAGVDLFVAEFNLAYFGRELGGFAGATQNQGITAELAFRF